MSQPNILLIMTDQWKLVFNRFGEPYLLFDQTNDPDETANLVDDHGRDDLIAGMQAQLFRHLMRTQVDQSAR